MTSPTASRYCEPSDLMLGQLSEDIPRWIGTTSDDYYKHIENAAEEIDLVIGRRYTLPLTLLEGSADQLLLKKLNRFIASGRILMAASAGNETDNVHQYAEYLLREAGAALEAIACGHIELEGQQDAPGIGKTISGPAVFLSDEDSFVRDFYGFGGAEYSVPSEIPAKEIGVQ